jgi:hypothetical protein
MSHNFMQSIREVSIDGHHNALLVKETFADLWDRRTGFFSERRVAAKSA